MTSFPLLIPTMSPSKSWFSFLPPLFLALSLLGVYLGTIAPGLTWANAGSDGGDLIVAAATGGIPHPTGYPLYLLLARIFQLLPVGSLAFRTNLMSAIFTALAAVLVYLIMTRSIFAPKAFQSWLPGMAAGYTFGLAPLVWSQAVITEVYALQAFLVALILYLYTQPAHPPAPAQKRLDCWRGLLLGLAMGNHLTTLLLVPAAFLVGSFHRQVNSDEIPHPRPGRFGNLQLDGHSIRRQSVWFGIGLLVYLVIPLRALAHSPVNWGNPVTFERFWWLVSGQLYQSYYLQISLPEFWERLQALAALLIQQSGLLGLVLGLVGLVIFGKLSRLYFFTVWTAFVSIAFTAIYGSADFYVYLIPMFVSFAIWIGLGIAGLIRQIPRRFSVLGLGLGLLLIGCLTVRSVTQVSQVDASHDLRAESFAGEVLDAAPKDAIIFAKGDQAVFALWYYRFALKERPDLIVLATDLLHFDWYQENLSLTYPVLVVPGPFPWPETIAGANPLRAICYVQFFDHTELDCSPPLSSP